MQGKKIRMLLGIGMFAFMIMTGSTKGIASVWGAVNPEQAMPEENIQTVLDTIFTEEVTEEELTAMTADVESDFAKILESEAANTTKKQWIELLNQYLGQQKQVYENGELQAEKGIDVSIQTFGEERRAKILDYQAACQIQFVKANPYVIVKDITQTEKQTVMNVYEWVFITYKDQGIESTSGFGFDHVITFEETQDGWSMIQDTFSDQSLAYLDSPSYQTPEENLAGSGEAPMKKGRTAAVQPRYTYNPDQAVAYADQYALKYNPAYSNFNPDGGDCANFVSQSLQAGGMPMNDGWYYTSYQNVSSSWINCSSQVNYFKNQGTFIEYPESTQVKKGNPVWYYRGGRWGHAAICVGTNASGTPVVDAHNNDRYRVTWTLGFSRCSTVQLTSDVGQPPKIGWVKDANGWKYYYEENSCYQEKWGVVGGRFYLFGEDHYMKTGWQKTDGKYYYLGGADDGSMKYGWHTVDGKRYYLGDFNDGSMKSGWQTIEGKRYYLGEPYDGAMKYGWQTIDGKKYYLGTAEDGAMQSGWIQLDGKYYYLGAPSDGTMKTGWIKISDSYYYLGNANDGVMKTGWQVIGDQWYYLGAVYDGAMKTGWQIIGDKWYYLGNVYDGAMKTGWQVIGKQWYYLGNIYDGAMKTDWQKIDGRWYYLGTKGDGAMKTSWQQIYGRWYFMHPNGMMAENQWIGPYYVGGNGAMLTNTWIGKYYVNGNGLWTQTK